MQQHFNTILSKIETEYGITQYSDWLDNDKAKMKKFQMALIKKIKDVVIEDVDVATEFIKSTVIYTYVELTKELRTENIERYIISGDMINPKLDIRTLEGSLKGEKMPTHKKILNAFSIYIYGKTFEYSFAIKNSDEFEKQNKEKLTIIGTKKIGAKVSQFSNTKWWLYYYNYDEFLRRGKLGIAVLTIENNNKVYLENESIDSETATHYVGSFTIENSNQHLYFDLTSTNVREKHLRITVFIGVGKVYPLLLGIYSNINAVNAMTAGSIVLEKVDEISIIQKMMPKMVEFEEAEASGVCPSIIQFVREREKNFIKTPSGILTKPKLKGWLAFQKHKQKDKKQT